MDATTKRRYNLPKPGGVKTRNGIRRTTGGWKFKAAIQDKGWTQADASRQLTELGRKRFSVQYISKLVNNRAAPGRERALIIERELGVPIEVW